jgi:ABC-type multidrug transport system fused ATPase/permease subunit
VIETFRRLVSLFPRRERRGLTWLLPSVLLLAGLQVLGIGSVMPFLSVVANPGEIETNRYLNWLQTTLGLHSRPSFLLALGGICLGTLVIANAASALITWLSVRYAEMRTHALASSILEQYLNRPYVFFLGSNSAELGVRVLADVVTIVSGMLLPALQLVSQGAMVLLLVLLLVRIDPFLSLVVLLVLGGLYAGIYLSVRGRLALIGARKAEANAGQFLALSEASGAVKEIKVFHLERFFLDRFKAPNLRMAQAHASQSVLTSVPHYALEVVAFGGILGIVLFKIASGQSIANVLPLVGLYGYAILRIKPALQTIYTSVTQIRFNRPVLDRVYAEFQPPDARAIPFPSATVSFSRTIELRDVCFSYPDAHNTLFNELSLSISAGSSVAFVGATGSGKTTLVDLILGLLVPDRGGLVIDGVEITDENRRAWQDRVSYVPQNIYLADDTVMRNIAFGRDDATIDVEKVEAAAKSARIHEFIVNEPDGYMSRVGERGVRISGGQRQRIGIARALYRDADVLILDEATSALDGLTEHEIFSSLQADGKNRTVITISHRLNSIRHYDVIFVLEDGRIIGRGTYAELMLKNARFHAMARTPEPVGSDA